MLSKYIFAQLKLHLREFLVLVLFQQTYRCQDYVFKGFLFRSQLVIQIAMPPHILSICTVSFCVFSVNIKFHCAYFQYTYYFMPHIIYIRIVQ
jgi:hypothetical protein